MAARGVDVLLVGQPANRQYLSGFSWHDESSQASAGWIMLTPADGFFVTNFLHYEAVRADVTHLEAVQASGRVFEGLVGLLEPRVQCKIGFEGGWVSYSLFEELADRLKNRNAFVPVDGLVEELRAVKDRDEVGVIQRAIAITDDAYVAVTSRLRPGATEREVAWALERELRERGADGMAFGPAVAAGPNAAVPHHEPTDYAIQPGDAVWIDMGAQLAGYCADLTRSFCLETASDEYLQTWELVLEAQRLSLAGLRAGVLGKSADALARDFFVTAKRGDEFGHGLGHGVGLMIHESPRVGTTSADTLEAGMIVTVEPGLYRAGWGGVRIEDVALIEANGATILSRAPKQPVLRSS
jgi:Xaa-Pro aminopeptidase